MGLFAPKFEPSSFAVEETGDAGTFVIDDTKIATKIYKLGVASDEDATPWQGVCLHFSLVVSGAGTNCTVSITPFGSLDGTTADTLAHTGTFRGTTYTITNLGILTHKITRVFDFAELGPYFGWHIQRTEGTRNIVATGSAKRFRYRRLGM